MASSTAAKGGSAGGGLAARILGEELIGLAAAAKRLGPGRGGKPTHPASVSRWITAGVRRRDGVRVYLEAIRVGGTWRTSVEALARFTDSATPQPPAVDEPAPRPPAARAKASKRANDKLAADGW